MEPNNSNQIGNDLMVFPVLLAGGSGTRLWPVSRTKTPKQLVELSGETSLLQESIQRLAPLLNFENVRVVCGEEHRNESADHMASMGISAEKKIISEPVGRNTAPAILLAVMKILNQENKDDAIFLILPADHVIRNVPQFHQHIEVVLGLAKGGHLVTFGIQPEYPETGYGYIEAQTAVGAGGFSIRRFVEKPDSKTAQAYIEAGNFYWNSGMFAFRGSAILDEFKKYQPEMLKQLTTILQKGGPISAAVYERLENISFDVAIMEKTTRGVVLPSDFGWSDIGTWKSLHDYLPKDDVGNVVFGDVVPHNTQNSLLIAKSRLMAVNDLSNVAIVETSDAVFISALDTSRNVKEIVSILKQHNRREHQVHLLERHEWGTIQSLEQSADTIVARVTIKPQTLAHPPLPQNGRCHICMLSGHGKISIGDISHPLQTGDSLSVALGGTVLLKNMSKHELDAIIIHQKEH